MKARRQDKRTDWPSAAKTNFIWCYQEIKIYYSFFSQAAFKGFPLHAEKKKKHVTAASLRK
jgi:hypothetical protein